MRRNAVKLAVLFAPLFLGGTALRLWGAPDGGAFHRMLARRACVLREEPPFRMLSRPDGPHPEALASLRGWMRAVADQHATLGLRAEGSILVRLFESDEDAAAFGPETGALSLVCVHPRRWTAGDERALLRGLALLLIGDLASRKPWLAEGLAGWLEVLTQGGPVPKAGGLGPDALRAARERRSQGDWATLAEVLNSLPGDFKGARGDALRRSSLLFTAFLLDARRDLFQSAWSDEGARPGPLGEFASAWDEWMDGLR